MIFSDFFFSESSIFLKKSPNSTSNPTSKCPVFLQIRTKITEHEKSVCHTLGITDPKRPRPVRPRTRFPRKKTDLLLLPLLAGKEEGTAWFGSSPSPLSIRKSAAEVVFSDDIVGRRWSFNFFSKKSRRNFFYQNSLQCIAPLFAHGWAVIGTPCWFIHPLIN